MVIALAILAGLVGIVASVAASHTLAIRAEADRINAMRARTAAEAGIQRALAAIAGTIQSDDNTTGTSNGSTIAGQAQMQTDEWYTLGNKGDERFHVGNGSFRIEIVDAASLVNINTALEAQLDLMPLLQEQIDALLDWREVSTTARTDGAKDEYYNNLTKPYNTKLRRFDSVDELLDVRYFTATDIWQITTNQTTAISLPSLADGRQPVLADLITTDSFSNMLRPDGTAMINISGTGFTEQQLTQAGLTQSAAALFANRGSGYTTLSSALQQVQQGELGTALDVLATTGAPRMEGKINLNTASEAVLMTIPNMTEDLAQGIVNYQPTGFTKLSDLLQVSGFSDPATIRNFADYFSVRSQVFLVRVVGEAGETRVDLVAVVDTSSGKPRIIKMLDQPYADMPTRWGWQPQPTTDTTLTEAH